jgi:hypothetical protein
MGCRAADIRGVGFDDLRPRDPGLEAERRTLDRGIHERCADIGKDVGYVHRVTRTFLGAPVGLIHLLLDDLVLERPERERIDRIEIQVVVGEEGLQACPLRR